METTKKDKRQESAFSSGRSGIWNHTYRFARHLGLSVPDIGTQWRRAVSTEKRAPVSSC
jgi:hypothetical protein